MQEYELLNQLAKQQNYNSTDNKLKIIKLQEMAQHRLEIEKILVQEDPKTFMAKVEQIDKWEELKKYGKSDEDIQKELSKKVE